MLGFIKKYFLFFRFFKFSYFGLLVSDRLVAKSEGRTRHISLNNRPRQD